MIPFWYLPYALACGNTYIVKPSEKSPLTMQTVFRPDRTSWAAQRRGQPGQRRRGSGGCHPGPPAIRAITFVGSTAVARYIYSRAAANGKRVQAQGGAKNPVVILPDADMDMAVTIIADSAFGCAGQRCLAASLAITVGEARQTFHRAASARRPPAGEVGYGLDEGVQMGPVITPASKQRIEELIAQGRWLKAPAWPWMGAIPSFRATKRATSCARPSCSDLPPESEIARTEIFGPVLGLMHVDSLDEAIALVNSGAYGNQASLFTSSGAAARKFRYEAEAGNIGINIGVAAPMAFFPFSGWKDSFFGDLHGQGMRRGGVLHPEEGGGRTLAEGMDAEVLTPHTQKKPPPLTVGKGVG